MKHELKKNIRTYILYTLFSNLIIIAPIIMIFYFAKGLSFTEILLLNSVSCIAVFIFEVPTGTLADKVGRKISVTIGTILWVVALVILILANNFFIFAIGEVVFSLGTAFKSGADVALLYDSLKEVGAEDQFQRIEGRAKSFSYYGQALGSIIASILYKLNMYLPMILSCVFVGIAAIISLRFIEPPIEDKKGKYGEGYFRQIYNSAKYAWNHRKIKAVMFYGVVFFVFYRAGYFFFQPYMKGVNIDVKFFGAIFAIFNIVAALASKNAHRIMRITKGKTMTLLSSTIIVSFVILGVTKVWIGFLAITLQQIARGLYHPIISKYMNKHIPSNKRATILSLYSLTANLVVAAASPFIGMLGDGAGVFNAHLILAAIMIVLTFITISYLRHIQTNK